MASCMRGVVLVLGVVGLGCPSGGTGSEDGMGPPADGSGSGPGSVESSDGQIPLPPPVPDDDGGGTSTAGPGPDSSGEGPPGDSSTGTPPPDPDSSTSGGGETCATVGDGTCDEPEGTGTCPEGTDVEDCALPSCTGDPDPNPIACDVFAQDCPMGEKCMPYAMNNGQSWDATGCFPIDCETVAAGASCTAVGSGTSGIDNCEEAAMCWSVDNNNLGYCLDFCTGSAANPMCAAPDTTCVITNGGVLALCLLECDPIMQDCTTGEGCSPVNDVFACAPDASGVQGQHGDACNFLNACDPGNACVAAASFTTCTNPGGCCTELCDLSNANADADCAALDAAQSCEPWFAGAPPAGYENVGFCTIP